MGQLKDKNGQNYYPDTKFENVTDVNGNTIEQRLESIGGGGSDTPSTKIAVDTILEKALYRSNKGSTVWLADNSGCTVLVYDVAEGEKLNITAWSRYAGSFAFYVFTDKEGKCVQYKVAAGGGSQYEGLKTFSDVIAPNGATRLYVNQNASVGSSSVSVTQLDGMALASYRNIMRDHNKVTDAELAKYYNLGAQKMDTYNLVKEKVGIIVIGQSNAAGRVPGADFQSSVTVNDKTINLSRSVAKCQIMYGETEDSTYTQEVEKTFSPFAIGESQTWGFDLVLYNEIANALNLGENEYFYVCKQTRGGTRLRFLSNSTSFSADIDKFKSASSKNSQLYHLKCLVKRALELQPDIKFKAIVMHQGEGDNSSTLMEGEYYMELCQTIQWIRGLVGSPNLPFIFGSIPTNSVSWNETVYNGMVKAAADLNDVYLVTIGEATDWVDDQWHNEDEGLHFGVNTAAKLADDMYNIMVSKKMLAPYV